MDEILDPSVVYDDLVFQESFVGREEVKEYCSYVDKEIGPAGVKFVVDDVADSGTGKVGVMW